MKSASNYHDTREGWLRAATNELRSYFTGCGYPLPEHIRFAIGFPSTGRKGNRVGECWHSSTSADEHFEIFIRADQSEPVGVLGVLGMSWFMPWCRSMPNTGSSIARRL